MQQIEEENHQILLVFEENSSKVPHITDVDEGILTKSTHHNHEQKQKRLRFRTKIYAPRRVLKADIRRQYLQMLGNCLNSYDLILIRRFLETFAHQNHFQYHGIVSLGKFSGTYNANLNMLLCGFEAYLWMLGAMQRLSPDRIVQYSDIKIRTFANSACCQLEAHSIIKGSVCYNIPLHSLVDIAHSHTSSLDSSRVNKKKKTKKLTQNFLTFHFNSNTPTDEIPSTFEEIFQKDQIKEKQFMKPIPAEIPCKLIISIDENLRITSISQISL